MKLRKGQIIYIDNQKYTVINMVEYGEDTWVWQEYEIVSQDNVHRWLSVEENENKQIEYSIYDVYRGNVNINEIEFIAENQKYELYEKGRALVKDYFGNADVDKYESCEYYDYISQETKKIISVEIWSGEKEQSIGTYIPSEKVRITEEIDQTKISINNKIRNGNGLANLIAFIFVLPVTISFFTGIFSLLTNKSIEKYLEKQSTKYTYVTSVTNNSNNKKAKVYKSKYTSIDTTVKDIIDGVPEGITKTIDTDESTDEDGIGLQTSKEYAYIYEEDGDIYVQVSNKEYVNSSASTYHSRRNRYYYNSYTSSNSSSTYSSYASSARQNSINSRKSSGGGTSSGK